MDRLPSPVDRLPSPIHRGEPAVSSGTEEQASGRPDGPSNGRASATGEQEPAVAAAADGGETAFMTPRRGTPLIEYGDGGLDEADIETYQLPSEQQGRLSASSPLGDGTARQEEPDEALQKSSHVQGLVFSLLENTGAHGIPNIKRAPNGTRKTAWTVLFVFGLVMFVWQTGWLLARYYAYGVDVKTGVSSDPMVEFPAVTVCNINPITSDFLDNLADRGTSLPPVLAGNRNTYGSQDEEAEFDDDFQSINSAVDFIGELDYGRRRESGHLLKDMLLRCRFQGRPCHVRDFTHFYNYLYGNCYIFNIGQADTNDTSSRLFVTTAGPLYGLTIELYIEQDQYSDMVQQAAGARVIVHPPHDMPFPEDEGVGVAPGHETFIGFKRRNFTRLTFPYSNCTEEGDRTIFNMALPHIRYSQRVCEKDCFYQNLTQECGCTDARYRYDDAVPLCTNTSQDVCLNRVEKLFFEGELNCKCTPACRELSYEIIPSYVRWPNEKYKPFLEKSFTNVTESMGRDVDMDDPNFIEKNVLKLNVYYDTLEYVSIYHDVAYDEVALLSDMGGNVGLWIGVSVLTVFEFVELLYDLCKLATYRLLYKKAKKQARVTSSDLELRRVTSRDTS